MQLTSEQRAAIESAGKTIVSASAGSGKTFVMIQKLVAAIESGVDLDNVLAVTFTKKAAAQMKEKLRSAIIARMEGANEEKRARLKIQLSKIPSASISTIHSFCAKLLRTYFYAVQIDGTFDIISADDAAASEYKDRAIETLFERYYAEDNAHFKTLLKCYRKKRSDAFLKSLILDGYEKLRIVARYRDLLDNVKELYTDEGWERVICAYNDYAASRYLSLRRAVENFASGFKNSRSEIYGKIFAEMTETLDKAAKEGVFAEKLALARTRKPVDRDEDKQSGEAFKAFKDALTKRYNAVTGDTGSYEEEREYFFKSGEIAAALAEVLKQFDSEYAAVKRDENKLDYNDLEHLTLALLEDERVRGEINSGYECVFVDEYQDVNPVQEEIITLVGGANVFLVGDVKQAIYGFRGSKSLFFAEKYNRFEGGDGSALRLSSNFRSSDGVINFVNGAFSQIMTAESCGFDYSGGSEMQAGAAYPKDYGVAKIHIFGKEDQTREERGIYSVKANGGKVKHTREGLAVLELVERELKGTHFDLKTESYVDTQAGDICILTRKRGNAAATGIVRALTDAGYSVSGEQEANICNRPEVKEMLDILSYLDDSMQDIPLTTALLSPLGNLSCDELAAIRIAAKGEGRKPFRDCCQKYASRFNNVISRKLIRFYDKIRKLRDLSDVLTAAELIDVILEETGLEAAYTAGGGEKLKNIRRLAAEGEGLGVSAFLLKLKDGGFKISAPSSASSDSIKIMTMHASKGLEFPVVIIPDICATFKGRDFNELPFDDVFGFAPKYYDRETMLTRNTVLRRLVLARSEREELKNELNLFYVACTRAMCALHILSEEALPYDPLGAADAKCYAELFDSSLFMPEELEVREDFVGSKRLRPILTSPDVELERKIDERFMREYAFADSVNLPVKSSASAILRLTEEDERFRPHELFKGEGETGTERGIAYHRFLELCDFSVKDAVGIAAELDVFLEKGLVTRGQRELLDENGLAEILNMSVFSSLGGAKLYREREFLCRLPANEILPDTQSPDGIHVQGAIDLLADTDEGIKIIDYKYSSKSDEYLVGKYSRQLALYKKAVSLIMREDERRISCAIVNIFLKRQIILN